MSGVPLKIGCVPYLNARPLIEGLEGVVLRPPSDLAKLLAAGRLDAALVPVAEIVRCGWAHVPGSGIVSRGASGSALLHHRVPIRNVRRVALDRNSRSTNFLTRILLEKRYGLKPVYVTRNPARGLSFKGYDAAVTIGDVSFRPRRVTCLDLGSAWKAFTGCPFVYALWATRRGHPRIREITSMLKAARKRGEDRLGEIARREAKRLGLTPRFCRAYLTRNITYAIGPAERAGLRLFKRYVRDLS